MEVRLKSDGQWDHPDASLRLQIPPDPRFGKYVRERVAGFASAYVIPDEDLREYLTAIGEAFANAVEHSRSEAPIEVTCWFVGGEQLIATVADSGVGFESAETAAANVDLPDAYAERGRGLAIMHRCTDHFTVRSTPGQGTAVVLGRYVRHRRAGQASTRGT
ncbi:MAG: ATP-binding protein [Candidatus Velthaea sp.]